MSINFRRNVNPFFPPNQLNSVILLYHYIVSMHSHYILFQINQRNNDFFRAFLVKCIFNAKGDFFSYKNRENNVILHFIQFQTLTILEYLRFNMIHQPLHPQILKRKKKSAQFWQFISIFKERKKYQQNNTKNWNFFNHECVAFRHIRGNSFNISSMCHIFNENKCKYQVKIWSDFNLVMWFL